MGDEYPGKYYTLPATSDNKGLASAAKLFCNDTGCQKGCNSASSVNKCSNGVYISSPSKYCVGGPEVDNEDSSIWVEEYATSATASKRCTVADALEVDISYVGPADDKCFQYTSELYAQFTSDAKGTYSIKYECDVNCTGCTVNQTDYTLGDCTDDLFVFQMGKNLDKCGGDPSGGKKKNSGAVAGAAIGAILGVACIGFIYFKFIRRRTSEYSPIS
jgi:hypothetical protein